MQLSNLSNGKLGWKASLSVLLLLLVSGCGGGGAGAVATSPLTVTFDVPLAQLAPSLMPGEKQILMALNDRDASLLAKYSQTFADFLIPDAHAVIPATATAVVTITGPGMTPIINTFPVLPGQTPVHTYQIPSGQNRSVQVQVFSGANGTGQLLYENISLIPTLQPGVPYDLIVPALTPVADQIPPVITLLGGTPVSVNQGTVYADAGATANDNVDGNITANIVTANPVNTAVVGVYTVTYNVSDAAGNAATQVTRTVSVVDITAPVITLTGATPVNVNQGAVYVDAGATANDNVDGNITANIVTANPVNTAVVGVYTVTYNVSDAAGNAATQVTRIVNVVDGTAPVITLIGTTPVSVTLGGVYNDAGATANDNVDGNVTANIVTVNPVDTAIVGAYTVTYDVSDAAGNAATRVTRTVNVDGTAPVITLTGTTPITINHGAVYNDAGATANDNIDGNITANIVTVNPVDTAVVGGYTVTYDVSDAAGNTATQVTRTVNVVDATAPVITLLGVSPTSVTQGDTYIDFGVTAIDNVDGNITASVVIANPVNTTFIGAYTITYDVSDAAGNVATQLTRTVNVVTAGVLTNNWQWGNPSPTGESFNTVAFNGINTYVAVGNAGNIFTSTDSISWTKQVSGTTKNLYDITWVVGVGFVAVGGSGSALGTGGVILTSADGIGWTAQISGTTNTLNSVIWNGVQYVAVGDMDTVLTSPDAITWSTQTSGSTKFLKDITWDGAQFVTVASSGTILTSPDAVNWTTQTSGTTQLLLGVTWSGTQYVAVGGSGTILTSPDAVNWTTQTSGTTQLLLGVTWSGTQYVAVGGAGTVLTSPDAITWTIQISGSNKSLLGVIWNGTQYIAVGASGTVLTSLDGIAWITQLSTAASYNTQYGISWNGTQYVAVGSLGTILSSPDTISWTAQTSGTTQQLNKVTWNGSQYVAVGVSGTILTSPDAITWTTQTSGSTKWLNNVTWNGSQYVVVGDSGTILTSPDAITWSAQIFGTKHLLGITWSGMQYVAVGASGAVLTSPDGITWLAQNSGSIRNLNGITWNGVQYVAVGSLGTILTSPDGITWLTQNSGSSKTLNGITSSGVQYIATGDSGAILGSLDGITWTVQSGTTQTLKDVIWNGTQFITVGWNGNILYTQ